MANQKWQLLRSIYDRDGQSAAALPDIGVGSSALGLKNKTPITAEFLAGGLDPGGFTISWESDG
jgi:hypothetical protein